MQIESLFNSCLYRTTLAAAAAAAARLTSEFTVSRIGNTMSRGMKSSSAAKSLNSPANFTDDDFPTLASSISTKQSKRRIRIDLQTSCKQKPNEAQKNGPLRREASAPKTNQIDTGLHVAPSSSSTRSKSRSIDHEHGEAKPLSTSDLYDTELPPGFWKTRSSSSRSPKTNSSSSQTPKTSSSSSRSPKQRYNNHENGEVKRRLTYSPTTYEDEPFDICFPYTGKTNSSVNEKNKKRWAPKIQLPDEIDDHIDDMEERMDTEKESTEVPGRVLRPGMVLFKHYISLPEQVKIVTKCRELGCGPGGFYRPGYNDGAKLRLYMMCLGLDWNPQTKKYGGKRHHDDAEPPLIPEEFTSLVCRVIDDSHSVIKREGNIKNAEDELPAMSPDVCIVNYYTTNGRLGLHQDRDESRDSLEKGLPVVSISLGDSADFLYGDQRDIDKAECVELESGDVLVFGGESRHIFHGVTSIIPGTAPRELLKNTNLRPGRLNLTFRKY